MPYAKRMNLLRLDHIALAAENLETGAAHTQSALGVPLAPGGEHALMGTHNKLLGLGPTLYFEAIAINPAGVAPDRPRWFNLDAFSGPPRLTNWIVQTDDLDAALGQLGTGFGQPLSLERGDLRWRMAVPETGVLPWGGWAPAVIEWKAGRHPAQRLPDSGLRLQSLRLRHPDALEMAETLGPLMPRDTVLFEPSDTPELIARFDGANGTKILR